MFLMDFLKFLLLCIDFLAWPMVALAYPLCASIRAIETGSKYHMKKLVTYWTIFSIISLIEHTLRLTEWVPYWPCIKLIGTLWLVIPQFRGACYAYECLVSADLGVKLHCFISQFKNELYVNMLQSKYIKVVEQTTEQEIEERKVKSAVGKNIIEDETIPAEIDRSKIVQKEWTCGLCQVITYDENSLKLHLEGTKHRAKCVELKSKHTPPKQETNAKIEKATNQEPARGGPKQNKENHAKHNNANPSIDCPTNQKPAQGGSKQKKDNINHAKDNIFNPSTDSKKYCPLCDIWCPGGIAMVSHLKGKKHLSTLKQTGISNQTSNDRREKVKATSSDKNENQAKQRCASELYCGLCSVTCPGEVAMVSHLKGKKHLSKLQESGIRTG